MNFFCIEASELSDFIKSVGPHEEIRPVPGEVGGPFEGKYILHATIGDSGPSFQSEVEKTHYQLVKFTDDSGMEFLPSIHGSEEIGSPLIVNKQAEAAYQWQRCDINGQNCEDIEGETGTDYTPGVKDTEFTIRCLVIPNGGGPPRPTPVSGTIKV